MFSLSPFPELPLSPNVFITPNLLFDDENNFGCFNSNSCFFHSPPIMENVSTIKQDFVGQQEKFSEVQPNLHSCEDHCDLLEAVICKKKPGASKKDGSSKIYTNRGPRDRRVRLSIEISRKFFCLQDLLGFDKASKTLDWLFSKTKHTIKELVEETNHCLSSTANDQCKASFLEFIKGDSDEDKGEMKNLAVKCLVGKKKKITQRKFIAGYQENLARIHTNCPKSTLNSWTCFSPTDNPKL